METDAPTLPTDTTPRILLGDALRVLRSLPESSIHCAITSYPYWGLRDYAACSCAQEHQASEALRVAGENVTPGNAGSWTKKPADPRCPECHGSGRLEMDTVWDEPPNPCAHQWDTTFRYWDNRHAAVIAATGSDQLGSNEDRRGQIGSTQCLRCGAWRGAFGLEPSVGLYVVHAVQIANEIRRVLRPDGTFWLNLGDSYIGGGRGSGIKSDGSLSLSAKQGWANGEGGSVKAKPGEGLKAKDLAGVPWRVALALQESGWYLRCDVIWSKPNPMPESVTDRPSRSHEYVFLLTKSERYFYDAYAVRTSLADSSVRRMQGATFWEQTGGEKDYSRGTNPGKSARKALENLAVRHGYAPSTLREVSVDYEGKATKDFKTSGVQDASDVKRRIIKGIRNRQEAGEIGGANLKSVWTIPPQSYSGAHFATFPEELVERCIKAGTSSAGACSICGTQGVREVKAEVGTIGHDWHPDKSLDAGRNQGIIPDRTKDGSYRRIDLGFRSQCDHKQAVRVPSVVLDPFVGSGTTLAVARRLGRRSVGIELNPLYVRLAKDRVGRFRDLESWDERSAKT